MDARSMWRWIVERFYGVLDAIIGALVLAGIVYLVGVFSGLLPILVISGPIAISLVIATILSLPILIAVAIIRRSRKKTGLIRPIRGIYKPARPLDLERLGLMQYIDPDPLLIDNAHKFILIQQTYQIDGHDGTFIMRYRGRNATTQVSRLFRDSVVGDSAADTSLMAIRTLDRTDNLPLKWKLLKDEPYKKLIEVYFRQPLNLGDIFDIELSCRWPGTFTRREDYVFYPIHYYRHGVEKLVGELVLNAPPDYVEGVTFDGNRISLESIQPQILEKEGKSVIRWEIDNPKHIYIIQYGRQDI